ncbi:F-box/kelch-repeat protein At3g06240-like [Prosopis cineraria]|uniref:F-box/kelch-repeat protein At3g06240-like n=1 Tax=Prosopis cineraria TaxID=364024 RepID=UPI00240FB7B5|nr:F-box/kelch-repeat protein At3g06240-like [Prosopis cineraria]
MIPRTRTSRWLKLTGFGYENETVPQAEVCSVASASWRSVTNGTFSFIVDEETLSHQMFVNGAIHWVVKRKRNDCDYSVLSFDVIKETFRELSLGPCLKKIPSKVTFWAGTLDSLAIPTCYLESSQRLFRVRVMKEYGSAESWTEVFCFDSSDYGVTSMVSALGEREIVLKRGNGGIVLVDLEKQSVSDLEIGRDMNTSVGSYAESLFLMNKEQGVCSY